MTRTVTSSPTVDATFARPGCSATPLRRGRSDPTPQRFTALRRDAVALTWDLTIHHLHQAFGRCVASPATEPLDDIQAVLNRMAHGTYGRYRQCGCGITADRLRASPTTCWCDACQM